MNIIRKYSGCVCGPFLIKGGHEVWHIAFEGREKINSAITELSRENEIIRIEEIEVSAIEFQRLLRFIPTLNSLIASLENFNPREREILRASIEYGFFDDPKKIKIQELANKIGLSKGILSRKLREIEKKTFMELCKLLSVIETYENTKENSIPKILEGASNSRCIRFKKFRKF
ncbi:MAG: helix-turn-helix domain-containing protein [Archaeoglobaceae archaeon]